MTQQTLSTVTLATIENYRHAASLAVMAYRTGSNRLIDAVNSSIEANVYSRTEKVAPQLTSKLLQVRSGLTDIMVKGIDAVSTGSDKAIEASSTTATKGVAKVAKFAAGIDNRVVANGIDAVVRLSMPGAQIAQTVSAKVAEGADTLSRVAAGKKVKPVRAVKAVKKAAVGAKRTVVRKAAATQATVTKKATAVKAKATVVAKKTVAGAKRKVAKVSAA
jgi:hypothetical protein